MSAISRDLAELRQAVADTEAVWQTAIRAAIADRERIADIAQAASISRERVYQIRDGRR